MSRIRTVKPEFWEHPKVTRVSRDARLLFLGLLNEADDEGKLRFSAKKLAGVLFGSDEDVGAEQINAWTCELERERLVARYEAEGAPLLIVCGFTEHQKVSHPSPSRLPDPPDDFASASGVLPEADVKAPETLRPDMEQGTGNREGIKEQGVELALVSPPATGDPVVVIFEAWQEATGHHKAVLDPKRRAAIVKARKHYSDEDLIDACRGVHLSPHNRGENERNTPYDDIALVLRDAEHVERFRDLARGQSNAPPRLPQGAEMVRRAVARAGGNP